MGDNANNVKYRMYEYRSLLLSISGGILKGNREGYRRLCGFSKHRSKKNLIPNYPVAFLRWLLPQHGQNLIGNLLCNFGPFSLRDIGIQEYIPKLLV